jgi:hypothetical protein
MEKIMSEKNDQKFLKLNAKIQDAYENNFLTGEGKDQIGNVMCALYLSESKGIAVNSGDMNVDDDFIPSVPLDDLYNTVGDKAQFVDEFDAVIDHACKGRMDTSELLEFMLSYR